MQYDNVEIKADEVRAVVKKFERRLKSGRVFFPEDAAFAMKCETFLKNAASGIEGLSVSGKSFTATDRTLYAESDQPKVVSVDEGDIIALFDNTKKGLFGNFAKKECSLGALVTTKGILTCNLRDGKLNASGFVTWPSIAVGKTDSDFVEAMLFLRQMRKGVFPYGPCVSISLWNVLGMSDRLTNSALARRLASCLDEMRYHLWYIARGKGNEFDYSDHAPETGCDVEDE